MRRARKRNTYSTFVVSDLEACSQNMLEIIKNHVVSGVPPKPFFWECLTRFPYFCILKSACFRRRWLVTKKHRRARKRNTYTTFVASEIPRKPKITKNSIHFAVLGGKKNVGGIGPAECAKPIWELLIRRAPCG